MITNFRGLVPHGVVRHSSFDPCRVDDVFTYESPLVPSSFDYKLDDLIAAGVKIAPVATDVLHDSSAVDSLVSAPVVSPSND